MERSFQVSNRVAVKREGIGCENVCIEPILKKLIFDL